MLINDLKKSIGYKASLSKLLFENHNEKILYINPKIRKLCYFFDEVKSLGYENIIIQDNFTFRLYPAAKRFKKIKSCVESFYSLQNHTSLKKNYNFELIETAFSMEIYNKNHKYSSLQLNFKNKEQTLKVLNEIYNLHLQKEEYAKSPF